MPHVFFEILSTTIDPFLNYNKIGANGCLNENNKTKKKPTHVLCCLKLHLLLRINLNMTCLKIYKKKCNVKEKKNKSKF